MKNFDHDSSFDAPNRPFDRQEGDNDLDAEIIHGSKGWTSWNVMALATLFLAALPTGEILFHKTESLVGWYGIAFCWFILLLFYFPRSRFVCITDRGIKDLRSGRIILFENIVRLVMKGRGQIPGLTVLKPGTIRLADEASTLIVPRRCDADLNEIFIRIHRAVPRSGGPVKDRSLAQYAREMKELFGDDKVFEYSFGKKRILYDSKAASIFFWSLGTMIGSVFTVIDEASPSQGFGVLVLASSFIMAILSSMIALAHRSRHARSYRSEMVVTPKGIAMKLDRIQGALLWDEVKNVVFSGYRKTNTKNCMVIVVPGAFLNVPDVFDRPLSVIAERVILYWQPEHR